ncbi:MAG TPA: TIGR01841 family phasin [Acidocella sp.]|jgi:phasin family protein|uniref:phasin family protein n=1 Tax=Acidocella sp. TaxID=50710 RepID=UPI002CC54E05|nr:TIGR01841 family phasin [Acidocella sp.]HVE20804.1 TIGR01841 family phasin [Acidocella sp.]
MADKMTSQKPDAETTSAARKTAFEASAAGQGAAPMQDFDFKKMFDEMKLPQMPDVEAVLGAHRRNLEALSEANRLALEGAQTVARRHMEIMQATMSGLTQTLREIAATDTPNERAAKHAELLKQAYENAVCNTRELGDLIQKSHAEAMEKLNRRFSEAMTEMQSALKK